MECLTYSVFTPPDNNIAFLGVVLLGNGDRFVVISTHVGVSHQWSSE